MRAIQSLGRGVTWSVISRVWVDLRTGLDAETWRKIPAAKRESNPQSSSQKWNTSPSELPQSPQRNVLKYLKTENVLNKSLKQSKWCNSNCELKSDSGLYIYNRPERRWSTECNGLFIFQRVEIWRWYQWRSNSRYQCWVTSWFILKISYKIILESRNVTIILTKANVPSSWTGTRSEWETLQN